MPFINDKEKDRFFRFIYGREENKKWTISLYHAVNGTDPNDTDMNDFHIETIEDVIYMGKKNDVAFIFQGILNLYEHQSSYNPNMPIRNLIYLSKIYEKLLAPVNANIYGSKLLRLPIPKLVTFYIGSEEQEDKVLRLSDSFEKREDSIQPDVEVTVYMININYGHNHEILDKCESLKEYAWFIDKIREYGQKAKVTDEVVSRVIDEMPDDAELKPFLVGHRAEVQGMILTEYNEEAVMKVLKDEAREKGLEEGREIGLEEGREEGINLVNTLNDKLLEDGRIEDLKRASKDEAYQKELLKEYNLI